MKKHIFEVVDTSLDIVFGEIIFEKNKLSFKLKPEISPQLWNRVGFFPLSNDRRSTFGQSIVYAIDSRLPLKLRNAQLEDKFDYITTSGLKVASDSFILRKKIGK